MALRCLLRAAWPAMTAAAVLAAPVAAASQPVPLNGAYDTFLDHSKQMFNGQPRPSEPSIQPASFTTTCDASGCVAHWLLVNGLADNHRAHGVRLPVVRRQVGIERGLSVPLRRRQLGRRRAVRFPDAQR